MRRPAALGLGAPRPGHVVLSDTPGLVDLVAALVAGLDDTDLGREQLVHADLAGNVLLDAVLWHGAPAAALDEWRRGVERQAMPRSALFRVLSDRPCDVQRYAVLGLA